MKKKLKEAMRTMVNCSNLVESSIQFFREYEILAKREKDDDLSPEEKITVVTEKEEKMKKFFDDVKELKKVLNKDDDNNIPNLVPPSAMVVTVNSPTGHVLSSLGYPGATGPFNYGPTGMTGYGSISNQFVHFGPTGMSGPSLDSLLGYARVDNSKIVSLGKAGVTCEDGGVVIKHDV